MDEISELVSQHGGAILAIDYGYAGPAAGDTLQAIKNHGYVDILETAGSADLTAHVDFTPLASAARKNQLHCHGPIEQGDFLLSLGLLERAGQLGHGKPPRVQDELRAAVQRLAGPDQMGSLFKVLAATSTGVEAAGFTRTEGQ